MISCSAFVDFPCHRWVKSFVHFHPLLLLLLFIAYTYYAGGYILPGFLFFFVDSCLKTPNSSGMRTDWICWEGNPCSSPHGHRRLDKCERLTLWSSRGTQQSLAMPWGGAPPNLQRGREMATMQLFHSCKAIIFVLFRIRDIYASLAVAMAGILIVYVNQIRKWDLLPGFYTRFPGAPPSNNINCSLAAMKTLLQ